MYNEIWQKISFLFILYSAFRHLSDSLNIKTWCEWYESKIKNKKYCLCKGLQASHPVYKQIIPPQNKFKHQSQSQTLPLEQKQGKKAESYINPDTLKRPTLWPSREFTGVSQQPLSQRTWYKLQCRASTQPVLPSLGSGSFIYKQCLSSPTRGIILWSNGNSDNFYFNISCLLFFSLHWQTYCFLFVIVATIRSI